MGPDDLRAVMVRDLRAVMREVSAYATDEDPWREVPGMANCGGTLALHLAGNIRHYVGAVLGGSGYVRDRDGEFLRRDVPRAVLVDDLAHGVAELERVLPGLTPATLASEFPVEVGGRRLPTARMLMHLATHLAYHLGQLDYHRRAVGPGGTIGAVSVLEL